MEDGKQNFDVSQPTPMKNVPHRRVLAIRVLKVSQPNRYHSFPSSTRPSQIKSSNSINIPITPNDYSSTIPPTPCNTPSHSQIDLYASRKVIAPNPPESYSFKHFYNNDDFRANSRSSNEICNNREKNSQRSPGMKKYIIIRKRQADQNEVADGHEYSPNLSKSSETYNQSVDALENNSTKKRICRCISTKMCVILCIFVFLLISGAILGTFLGILFTRNLL